MADVEPHVSTYGAAKWAGKPGPGLVAACAAVPVPTSVPAAAMDTAANAARRATLRLSVVNLGRDMGILLAVTNGYGVDHCWLVAPVQVQICSRVPLALLGPVAS